MNKKMRTIIATSILILLFAVNSYAQPLPVYPTGNEANDRLAVQTAVNQVSPGGTILLKATDLSGVPTAFNFGKFEYNVAYPPSNSLSMGDLINHMVLINKGIVIQGETTTDGQMTTVLNGWQSFVIGAAVGQEPNGDVTIQGIHFKDSGLAGIFVARTFPQYAVTIRDNKFTGRLYDLFNFNTNPKPYWIPTEGWHNGAEIRMMNKDGQDVTGSYDLPKRQEAWKNAYAYMSYNPGLGLWAALGIYIGGNPGGVQGPFYITNNYLNLEEDSDLPSQFEKVWHQSFVIYFLGSKGNVDISHNIIKNGTARDINLLDLTGEIAVIGNEVEIGPLGSYHLSTVKPYLSKTAIAAAYRFFYGDASNFPAIGGTVYINQNTIKSSFDSKDAGGINVYGLSIAGSQPSTWNSACIEDNDITILNGRHGIALIDTGGTVANFQTQGANVVHNKIKGSGLYALRIGSMASNAPLNTANNVFIGNNIAQFQALASGTSSPELTAAHLYLDSDTQDNILVGFSGTLIDLGSWNHITGQPHTIQGGVGPGVSETMHEIQEAAPF